MRLGLQSKIWTCLAIVGLALSQGVAGRTAAASVATCAGGQPSMIVVERLQGGVAGQTGERTLIGEDGCFAVDRTLNGKVIVQLRSGRLGPNEMGSVRAAIDAAGFASLPEQIGDPPMVTQPSCRPPMAG